MKKYVISFLMLYAAAAPAQESGVYRDKTNQNELLVEVSDLAAKITGWNYTVDFPKNASGQYMSQEGAVLTAGKDRSVIITGKTGFVENFSLYAPLKYTLPEGVKDFVMDGKTYFYKPGAGEEGLVGEYLYEGNKEPKALLSADGSGYFQRHMVAPDEFEWWGVETNYKGEVQKLVGNTGNYKMIIAIKYKNGKYDRSQVVVLPGERKTYLLGERIMTW